MEIASQKLMIESIKEEQLLTQLNGILWDRDVTPQTKTHIYHAIVKRHSHICGRNTVFKS
jgi:hypothetical protein